MREFGTCQEENKSVQTWQGKPEGKSPPARYSRKDLDNIKVDHNLLKPKTYIMYHQL